MVIEMKKILSLVGVCCFLVGCSSDVLLDANSKDFQKNSSRLGRIPKNLSVTQGNVYLEFIGPEKFQWSSEFLYGDLIVEPCFSIKLLTEAQKRIPSVRRWDGKSELKESDYFVTVDWGVWCDRGVPGGRMEVATTVSDSKRNAISIFEDKVSFSSNENQGEVLVAAAIWGGTFFLASPVCCPWMANAKGRDVKAGAHTGIASVAKRFALNLEKSISKIESEKGKKPSYSPDEMSFGTGFSIAPNEILTAFHVVENAKKIQVRFPGEDWIDAEVKVSAQSLDTALLTIDKKRKTFLPVLSSENLASGDSVFTFGYPVAELLGNEAKFSDGAVASISGLDGDKSLIQCTVPIQPGNSGGPLVDEYGCVVGIITSTAAPIFFARRTGALPQNVNWAVNIDYVLPLLGKRDFQNNEKDMKTRREIIRRVKDSTCYIRVVH